MKNSTLKKSILSGVIALSAITAANSQVLYDNGPYYNRTGTGAGGANESVLWTTSLGMGTIGFGHQALNYNRVADDFVTTDCRWQIDSIVFFGYQTGSTTTSTFTGVNFRVWDSIPNAVGSNIVFGDTTTNRLTRTVWSGAYRITETTTGNSTRPIMRNVCSTPGLVLPAGTYWLDWASTGSLASGPWAPARVPSPAVAVTGNGRQRIGSTWNNALDGGTGTPAQGFPFIIYGTILEPTASAGMDVTMCEGVSYTMNGSGSSPNGAVTFDWTNGLLLSDSTIATPSAMPTDTTTFVIVVTDNVGCVATDTMVLTVKPIRYDTIAPVVCATYTSPLGNTYTSSASFTETLVSSIGCDSMLLINLTVNNPTTATLNPATCYSYLSPAGNTYTASGTYTETLINTVGCDSTITINLTINGTTTASISPVACYSYTSPSGMILNASGMYMDTIANANGCDSVITINLTINTVDTSITMTGVQLTANESGATYQWLNCDSAMAPIVGETGQSYFPLQDGNYAVVVTINNCTDTSGCINVIGTGVSHSGQMPVDLYPNPTNGMFTLNFGSVRSNVSVVITDINGKTVSSQAMNSASSVQVEPTLAPGTYFVNINADGMTAVKRLIIN